MVVCFSIGRNTESVLVKIKKSIDDVEFYSYSSVDEIIKEATLRHINFKRIVISNNILKDSTEDLKKLNDFIKNYSSSTEVVLMLDKRKEDYVEVANKFINIFNSPLYTIADPGTPTVRVLLDIIHSDIVKVNELYFPSSIKNSTESVDSFSSDSNTLNETSNGTTVSSNTVGEESILNNSVSSTFSEQIPINENGTNLDTSEKTNFNPSGGVLLGSQNNSVGNEYFEEDLSLGSFGSSHSDTGYLTSDDEEELRSFVESKQEVKPAVQNVVKPQIDWDTKQPEIKVTLSNYENKDIRNSNVNIIMSPRSKSNVKDLVAEAKSIAKIDEVKVLIIDLDVRSMSLLANFNVGKFYAGEYYKSFSSRRFYFEDDVYLASTGMAGQLNKDLLSILLQESVKVFSMIFIYCPIDCLELLDMSILSSNEIILNPGNCISDYVQTSLDLTNRRYVSLQKERYIMKNCLLDVSEKSSKEISSLRRSLLFSNGSWMDRVGL